jgi:hypothetical protein
MPIKPQGQVSINLDISKEVSDLGILLLKLWSAQRF